MTASNKKPLRGGGSSNGGASVPPLDFKVALLALIVLHVERNIKTRLDAVSAHAVHKLPDYIPPRASEGAGKH